MTAGTRNLIVAASVLTGAAVGWVTLYGLFYCGVLLGLAVALFNRRDFK